MIRNLVNTVLLIVVLAAAGVAVSLTAQTQKSRTATNAFRESAATQQPLYKDYKGVQIGMTADEARAKLGQPALKGDDQDFYVFSDKETAQVLYDAQHIVRVISVDYLGGVGAPDPQTVVGGDLELRNGSAYKLVRYERMGFWVSYNRTPGPMMTVTITLQKI